MGFNKEIWEDYIRLNKDPRGKCCIDVAWQVMKRLDEDKTPLRTGVGAHTPYGIICQSAEDINAGDITEFSADFVSKIIIECHSRSEEWEDAEKGICPDITKSSKAGIDIMLNALEKIKDCPMHLEEMIAEAAHALYCVNNSVMPSENTKSMFNLFR